MKRHKQFGIILGALVMASGVTNGVRAESPSSGEPRSADSGEQELQKQRERLMADEAQVLKELGQDQGSAPTTVDGAAVVPVTVSQEQGTEKDSQVQPMGGENLPDKSAVLPAAVNGAAPSAPADNEEPRAALRTAQPKAHAATERNSGGSNRPGLDRELARLREENAKLQATLSERDSTLASMQENLASLQQAVHTKETQLSLVSKELEESRNRLFLAETEADRLSGVMHSRGAATRSKYNLSAPAAKPQVKRVSAPAQPPAAPAASPDMPVATVISDKANLRTGPGKDNSPFITVSRGTRLAVETRQGEWYRVISPTGARAWVSSEVLAFGPDAQSAPTDRVRIRGVDPTVDDAAFDFITSNLNSASRR